MSVLRIAVATCSLLRRIASGSDEFANIEVPNVQLEIVQRACVKRRCGLGWHTEQHHGPMESW